MVSARPLGMSLREATPESAGGQAAAPRDRQESARAIPRPFVPLSVTDFQFRPELHGKVS